MAITDFTIIRRSLTAKMFSTVTTVLTVAVAVGLMLVLLAMRESSERAFDRGTGNMHLLVSAEGNRLTSVLNAVFYAQPPQAYITWPKYESIVSSFGGAAGPPPYEFAVPIQQGDSFRGFPVTATIPEFFTKFSTDPAFLPDVPAEEQGRTAWRVREGRTLEGSFEAVLGSQVARAADLHVGDRIHLAHGASDPDAPVVVKRAGEADHDDHAHDDHEEGEAHDHAEDEHDEAPPNAPQGHVHDEFDWTVVGVLEPTGSAHDRAIFTDLTSAWVVHAHDRRERELEGHIETTEADLTAEDRKITGILIRVRTRPGRTTSAAMGQVFYQFSRDPELTVASPSDEVEKLFQIVSNIDQVLLGMAAVVMVSSGIAIMLALYNSMEQRRRQIAVLRVLGCSRGRIFRLVLGESACLGAAGAVAGVLLCMAGSRVVAAVLEARLGLVVEPRLDWFILWPVLLGAVALAMLAGVVPATMAYRTSVANNLRPLG